jgi:hypothetical protein
MPGLANWKRKPEYPANEETHKCGWSLFGRLIDADCQTARRKTPKSVGVHAAADGEALASFAATAKYHRTNISHSVPSKALVLPYMGLKDVWRHVSCVCGSCHSVLAKSKEPFGIQARERRPLAVRIARRLSLPFPRIPGFIKWTVWRAFLRDCYACRGVHWKTQNRNR